MDILLQSSSVPQKAATLLFVVDLVAFKAHHAIYAVSQSEVLASNSENIETVRLLFSNMVRMQQQRITNHLDKCKAIWDLVQHHQFHLCHRRAHHQYVHYLSIQQQQQQ